MTDQCVPLAPNVAGPPAAEATAPPFGPIIKQGAGQQVRPFRIGGGGPASDGLPLAPGLTSTFSSSGNATSLGKYTGDGTFTLGSLTIDETNAVTGTFQGTFVFVAANGDELAVTFGDGFTGTFTGTFTGASVVDVEFDAFFSPDPANSSGRFRNVVGGGWRMLANADSVDLVPNSPFTAPFDYSWSGVGTLNYPKGK